ncbi:MAG TPA: tripartite tricarboxylate transporter substrate binding protein [Burkholderiales bacterium]|nr:tripartite tricarboxylate transporter substrate binding protein [Burkholderiales bacterium]
MMRALLSCVALCFAVSALGQADYPSRPVKVIVPLAAAGTGDTLARTVSEELAKLLGQPFVVENRPGAGGLVGTEAVAAAAPDGYTLLAVSPSHVINPALHQKKTYDPLAFEPVILFAHTHQVLLANPSAPFSDLKGLIAYDKANPGKLNYGSAGTGSATHLNMELFQSLAGTHITHIPYKGSTQARTDVVAGQVQLAMDGLLPVLPLIKDGKLKALALASTRRSKIAPEIPTMAEAGVPGYKSDTWYGLIAPPKTPPAIVAKLNAAAAQVLHSTEIQARLSKLGAEPAGGSPQDFRHLLESEQKVWTKVVKDAGVKAD